MDFGYALKGANQKKKLKYANVGESLGSLSDAAKGSVEPEADSGQNQTDAPRKVGKYYGPEKATPGETDGTGKRPDSYSGHQRYLKAAGGHVPSAYSAAKKAGDSKASSKFMELMKKTAKGK